MKIEIRQQGEHLVFKQKSFFKQKSTQVLFLRTLEWFADPGKMWQGEKDEVVMRDLWASEDLAKELTGICSAFRAYGWSVKFKG